jgi:hypothetical protein
VRYADKQEPFQGLAPVHFEGDPRAFYTLKTPIVIPAM